MANHAKFCPTIGKCSAEICVRRRYCMYAMYKNASATAARSRVGAKNEYTSSSGKGFNILILLVRRPWGGLAQLRAVGLAGANGRRGLQKQAPHVGALLPAVVIPEERQHGNEPHDKPHVLEVTAALFFFRHTRLSIKYQVTSIKHVVKYQFFKYLVP